MLCFFSFVNFVFFKRFYYTGRLTMDGFDSYLQSDDNLVVGIEAFTLDDDLNQPLSHYFVNSSHNTYLTGFD